jgi:hypothetical protein
VVAFREKISNNLNEKVKKSIRRLTKSKQLEMRKIQLTRFFRIPTFSKSLCKLVGSFRAQDCCSVELALFSRMFGKLLQERLHKTFSTFFWRENVFNGKAHDKTEA